MLSARYRLGLGGSLRGTVHKRADERLISYLLVAAADKRIVTYRRSGVAWILGSGRIGTAVLSVCCIFGVSDS